MIVNINVHATNINMNIFKSHIEIIKRNNFEFYNPIKWMKLLMYIYLSGQSLPSHIFSTYFFTQRQAMLYQQYQQLYKISLLL